MIYLTSKTAMVAALGILLVIIYKYNSVLDYGMHNMH